MVEPQRRVERSPRGRLRTPYAKFAAGHPVADDPLDLPVHRRQMVGHGLLGFLRQRMVGREHLRVALDLPPLGGGQGQHPAFEARSGRAFLLNERFQRIRDCLQPAFRNRAAKRGLAGEVAIHVGVAHAEGAGDVHHRGLGEAVAAEQGLRRRQDPLPRLDLPLAHACRSLSSMAMLPASYRAPATLSAGTACSMRARSSLAKERSRAPSDSRRRARVRAPTKGRISAPRDSTQAIASCAVVARFSSASPRSASTRLRLDRRFSPCQRGDRARKSRALRLCALVLPSRPRESTPYAVMPTPSSRAAGRISASRLLLISEYSICSPVIGWTAWARRSVPAPTSERPT